MIMQLLMSILLGLIPEVLYFTMFLIYTKDIKDKKIKLGILISIAYIICMFVQRYKTLYYIIFVVLIYLILKLLYKKKAQIIDIFVFSSSFVYMIVISYICFMFFSKDLSNYYYLMIVDRIVLFLPFLFRNKFNKVYKLYCSLWNRNYEKKQPIKSITLRNISLITINIAITLTNIFVINVINFIK